MEDENLKKLQVFKDRLGTLKAKKDAMGILLKGRAEGAKKAGDFLKTLGVNDLSQAVAKQAELKTQITSDMETLDKQISEHEAIMT